MLKKSRASRFDKIIYKISKHLKCYSRRNGGWTTIQKRFSKFKRGRESIEDASRAGGPIGITCAAKSEKISRKD